MIFIRFSFLSLCVTKKGGGGRDYANVPTDPGSVMDERKKERIGRERERGTCMRRQRTRDRCRFSYFQTVEWMNE